MATTKYSRQRESIINFLKSSKEHPTADVIYQNLRVNNPNISLGTVYRNLTKLTESGTILKISCNDASDHFDGNTEPHAHFICNCCHHIIDLDMNALDFNRVLSDNHFEGTVTNAQVVFYGECHDCVKNHLN